MFNDDPICPTDLTRIEAKLTNIQDELAKALKIAQDTLKEMTISNAEARKALNDIENSTLRNHLALWRIEAKQEPPKTLRGKCNQPNDEGN